MTGLSFLYLASRSALAAFCRLSLALCTHCQALCGPLWPFVALVDPVALIDLLDPNPALASPAAAPPLIAMLVKAIPE